MVRVVERTAMRPRWGLFMELEDALPWMSLVLAWRGRERWSSVLHAWARAVELGSTRGALSRARR